MMMSPWNSSRNKLRSSVVVKPINKYIEQTYVSWKNKNIFFLVVGLNNQDKTTIVETKIKYKV
jgi:hypothetical protein